MLRRGLKPWLSITSMATLVSISNGSLKFKIIFQCKVFLSVWIASIVFESLLNVNANYFCSVVGHSHPYYELQLKCKTQIQSNAMKTFYNVLSDWISQSSYCLLLILLSGIPLFIICKVLVSQQTFQSLLWTESSDKFLGRFLERLLSGASLINWIPESDEVSCWGCKANST